MADEGTGPEDASETDEGAAAPAADAPEEGNSSGADEVEMEGGLDVGAERGRLDEVEAQIEEGRRALADLEEDIDPEPDGPPVAAGEGAANAPPG